MPSPYSSAQSVTPNPTGLSCPSAPAQAHANPAPAHDFETRLLHLAAWPQLTRMPAGEQPTAARLCALLARRPTAGSLVPVLLGRPRPEVFALIMRLRQSGHLLVGGEHVAHESHEGPALPAEAPRPHDSLLEPLWRRLGFHL